MALNELKVLFREGTFLSLLAVFLLITFFSGFIGWSTKNTISSVYRVSIEVLKSQGVSPIPTNPVLEKSQLAIFDNMVVYIFLIGSLLAIVVGHRSFIRERRSGVIKLILSKPIDWGLYMTGKMAGVISSLFLIMSISLVISLISTTLIQNQHLSYPEVVKFISFYVLSFGYLWIYAMLGLIFAIYLKSETMALLVPIIIWIIVSFILPELTTGLDPVSLLNPADFNQNTLDGSFFKTMQSILAPVSIGQQYKIVSGFLLESSKRYQGLGILEIINQSFASLISLAGGIVLSSVICLLAMTKYSVTKDNSDE